MKKTCPKCGADGNGKPAPKESRYWCSSSGWENGDFYQSPECVKRERDNLLERVKRLEEAGDALKDEAWPTMFDDDASRKRSIDSIDAWIAAKESKP
jgi:hypothetical protein